MAKQPKSEIKTEVVNGVFQCTNLKFMTDFIFLLKLTTTDIAEKIGLSRQSVHHMFSVDDMRLSMAQKITEAFGYSLDIDLVRDGEEPPLDIDKYLIKFPKGKITGSRMTFLRVASIRYGIDLKQMGKICGLGVNTISYYLSTDDIFIAQLMHIAECCGMKVKITITENDTKKEKEDANVKDSPQIVEFRFKEKK